SEAYPRAFSEIGSQCFGLLAPQGSIHPLSRLLPIAAFAAVVAGQGQVEYRGAVWRITQRGFVGDSCCVDQLGHGLLLLSSVSPLSALSGLAACSVSGI